MPHLAQCSPNQADANLGTTDPSYSQGIQDVAHTMPHLAQCSPNQADANLGTTDPSYSQGIQDVAHTMPHLTQFSPNYADGVLGSNVTNLTLKELWMLLIPCSTLRSPYPIMQMVS